MAKSETKNKAVTFTIKGKEHELKLSFKSIKILSSLQEGGAFGLVAKAMMGDDETYSNLIYAGLLHTDEDYSMLDVEDAIEELFEQGKLDIMLVLETLHKMILEHPYFKETVERILTDDPNAKEALEKFRG